MLKNPIYELTLVRHGQTDFNSKGAFVGISDDPLNKTGREQASLIGKYLYSEGLTFHQAFSSPLNRAFETAQIIQKHSWAKLTSITKEPLLRERNYGLFEGKTTQEVNELYPEIFKEYKDNKPFVQLPEGETAYELESRIREFLWTKLPRLFPQGGNILIVTHLNPIRAILHLLKIEDWDIYFKSFKNTSVTRIRTDLNNTEILMRDFSCAEDISCQNKFT